MSVGVADITPQRSVEEIYKACDSALYVANVLDRDRVALAGAAEQVRANPKLLQYLAP